MSGRPLRVAFLVGGDTDNVRYTIGQVCQVAHIQPAAVFIDTDHPVPRQRLKHLRRNIRREGPLYAGRRLIRMIRDRLDAIAARIVPSTEVDDLLRRAFPNQAQSLSELAARYGFDVFHIGNLNSVVTVERLRQCRATIGVVLGTRILKRSTFSVPELGCLNLHKGKVPEFRGMPPGFWELYEGAAVAGVTVHFVDDGLDTGDIVGESDVAITSRETPASLQTKLDREGARLLCRCIQQVQAGTVSRRRQELTDRKARTKPTRAQELELFSRAPHIRRSQSDLKQITKTALYLFFFHSGIYRASRRRARGRYGRGAIVLYHRVNNISVDPLTASPRAFAEHLVMLRRHYNVVATAAMVDAIRRHEYLPPGSVAIHFDDCYRDVSTTAAPLLAAAGMPAAMFISSGFIDTDRVFDHDAESCPHRFDNLRGNDIPVLVECGFEIGAHTVNHVNLGAIAIEEARWEVIESKRQLESRIGAEVKLFSFPFGRKQHFQPAVREIVEHAGYDALFSAYGGFVSGRSDPFDIPRMGVSSEHRPLDLMMELEGLSLSDISAWLRFRKRP
jgi:peptidoglycan/xylan/chitin deacetylase (PgdA/CDA1 family)